MHLCVSDVHIYAFIFQIQMISMQFHADMQLYKGRVNFRKSSKWPLTYLPYFRKIMMQFFPKKPWLKVQNMQHRFLNWKCSENSSVLVASLVPQRVGAYIFLIRILYSDLYKDRITEYIFSFSTYSDNRINRIYLYVSPESWRVKRAVINMEDGWSKPSRYSSGGSNTH